jgi:hypothetical protein
MSIKYTVGLLEHGPLLLRWGFGISVSLPSGRLSLQRLPSKQANLYLVRTNQNYVWIYELGITDIRLNCLISLPLDHGNSREKGGTTLQTCDQIPPRLTKTDPNVPRP